VVVDFEEVVHIIDYQQNRPYALRVPKPPVPVSDASMPVLLRGARNAYAGAIRKALEDHGCDDVPKNGSYVIGGLAVQKGGRPLSQLIAELQISKQAAGQLIDTLVVRGYLKRDIDPADRRRLTIALTERGRAAAKAIGAARATIDVELIARAGHYDIDRARRVLALLIDIGYDLNDEDL
jgi:DNA-binding MarR family transcriptional regulator